MCERVREAEIRRASDRVCVCVCERERAREREEREKRERERERESERAIERDVQMMQHHRRLFLFSPLPQLPRCLLLPLLMFLRLLLLLSLCSSEEIDGFREVYAAAVAVVYIYI